MVSEVLRDFERALAETRLLETPVRSQLIGDLRSVLSGLLAHYANTPQKKRSPKELWHSAGVRAKAVTRFARVPKGKLTAEEAQTLLDVEMMLSRKLLQHSSSTRQLFLYYDTNRNGVISAAEFLHFATDLGQSVCMRV